MKCAVDIAPGQTVIFQQEYYGIPTTLCYVGIGVTQHVMTYILFQSGGVDAVIGNCQLLHWVDLINSPNCFLLWDTT